MNEVTRIINAIEQGDSGASEKLLPLVYEELRVLAAQKMTQEKSGQTLQATALVHEVYMRLVEGESQNWNSRGRVECVRIGYFARVPRLGGQVPKGEHRVLLKVLNPTDAANLILEYAIIYSDKPANQAD